MKPIVGITIGDLAGIGPEIVVKALQSDKVWRSCRPCVYVPAGALAETAKKIGYSIEENFWGASRKGHVVVRPVGMADLRWLSSGRPRRDFARLAWDAIHAAVKDIQHHRIHALVTGPVHKGAMRNAGIPFTGHTELLAELTHTENIAMAMMSSRLKLALATTHVPLRGVAPLIRRDSLARTIKLFYNALKDFGIQKPRVGVSSLNPHGGEDGGMEEKNVIKKVILKLRRSGMNLEGPVSSDALFFKAYHGIYDGVVSMYHDQGLTPFKMVCFDEGVNVTLGLPFVRTSPDHGTAFDIAGKNKARAESMIEAICVAARLAKGRL